MPKERLREELTHLHEELERASSVDAPSRDLLESLLADIQRLLDDAPAGERGEADDDSLTERVGDTVRHLEETHPALAVAVGRIATALSNLGI